MDAWQHRLSADAHKEALPPPKSLPSIRKPLPPNPAVNPQAQVDPDEFVTLVGPMVAKCDPQALFEFLRSRWTRDQIIGLLKGAHNDARKVAALCLSVVGSCCCIPELTQMLKDEEPCVNQLAEHALWSIWFRGGSEKANCHLAHGVRLLSERNVPAAIEQFDKAIALSPDFAEAYNERAMAKHLLEEWDESLADCHRAVERMPGHFEAWASMGHNFAHLGQWKQAAEAYDRALSINPHMKEIREALDELRTRDQSQ